MKKSIWEYDVKLPRFDSLHGTERCDVLVIGGGIAGIMIAHRLKMRGVDYLLIEKDRILSHNTKNTTAKITYQHGLMYHKISELYGTERAHRVLDSYKNAFSEMCGLCESVSCDFEYRDNYVYSVNNRAALEAEMKTLDILGYGAVFKEDLPLPVSTVGAVCFPRQAQFNPLKLLSEIAKNLNIRELTRATKIKNGCVMTTRGTIHAKKIICATHFPFPTHHGFFPLKLYQSRSYVLALDGAEDVAGMYVDENTYGLSFRNYKNILLLGGGAHKTGSVGGGYAELSFFKEKHYPDCVEICRSSAQDCMSLDGLPYIGKYSKATPELLVATGFNKWGMTNAMLSSMLITDEILGVQNDYAALFSPSRKKETKQLLINVKDSAKNLLTLKAPRCSHLGCALKWNSAERSWDCPCHGSRYTSDGEVLEGPAKKNIDTE